MKRPMTLALIAAGLGASVAFAAVALVSRADAATEQVKLERFMTPEVIAAQPDTRSPNWKSLSDDVGIMIRDDDKLGLRGRLFLRVNQLWVPVAADGLSDVLTRVPVR